MFREFAEAEQSAVPVVRKSRVRGLRDGASVTVGDRNAGTGYNAYEAMAVRTTRTVRRGFESDRKAESWRRNEFAGWRAATVVRTEEALGGSASGPEELAAPELRFAACRRR